MACLVTLFTCILYNLHVSDILLVKFVNCDFFVSILYNATSTAVCLSWKRNPSSVAFIEVYTIMFYPC